MADLDGLSPAFVVRVLSVLDDSDLLLGIFEFWFKKRCLNRLGNLGANLLTMY